MKQEHSTFNDWKKKETKNVDPLVYDTIQVILFYINLDSCSNITVLNNVHVTCVLLHQQCVFWSPSLIFSGLCVLSFRSRLSGIVFGWYYACFSSRFYQCIIFVSSHRLYSFKLLLSSLCIFFRKKIHAFEKIYICWYV